jgi:molecular chaperone GrpE
MPKERRIQETDGVPPRDEADGGVVAEGDAQLDAAPPNVTGTGSPNTAGTGRPNTAGTARSDTAGSARPDSREPATPNAAAAAPPDPAGPVPPHEELIPTEFAPDEGEELITLQREFANLSDRHLRLAAEFDNYRRRSERERVELWARAQADLAMRLLDALDDLDRVTHHAESASADALLRGMQLVERKLRQSLQAAGLETVEPKGARFDPNSMEAVALVPADTEEDDGVVADVFQRGYRFKGALLRPARVRVKKHGA